MEKDIVVNVGVKFSDQLFGHMRCSLQLHVFYFILGDSQVPGESDLPKVIHKFLWLKFWITDISFMESNQNPHSTVEVTLEQS